MNLIPKKNFTLLMHVIFLFITISACAAVPGTLEISLQPESQAISEMMDMEELSPVLESILFGSIDERRALVSYTTTACTHADGLGGPPKCAAGQEEGTLVEVLPVLAGEGSFSTPETIDQALDFVVMGLFAVYRMPQDANQDDYSPAGEFGLIFTREMNAMPLPLTVFVEDGRIVRLQHHFGTKPEDLLNQVPVDLLILDPPAAQQWVAENSPVEPPDPEIQDGTISGSVCFPGESIPALTLYFKEINRGDIAYQAHPGDQESYSISLPPGFYQVFAYPENSPDIGGSYSQAVVCGLGTECTDHSPLVVQLEPGAEIPGVDICDWTSPADVPPNPASSENTQDPKPTGAVSGKICYPSEFIPEMTLFFQDTTSQQITRFTIEENQTGYNVNLVPGQYTAYAYLNSGASLGGSYSQAVLCGLSTNCDDHSLVQININPGETLTGIDICDWYSPDTIPPDPRAALAPFTGMVYQTRSGDYFWIETNGDSKLIHSGSMLAVPYSGPHGVYLEGNDLFALDLFTGESYQLTDTPDLVEPALNLRLVSRNKSPSPPGQLMKRLVQVIPAVCISLTWMVPTSVPWILNTIRVFFPRPRMVRPSPMALVRLPSSIALITEWRCSTRAIMVWIAPKVR